MTAPPPILPDVPVLGLRSPAEVVEALRAMGDPVAEAAAGGGVGEHTRGVTAGLFGWGRVKAWQHTEHPLGFIRPADRQPLRSNFLVFRVTRSEG